MCTGCVHANVTREKTRTSAEVHNICTLHATLQEKETQRGPAYNHHIGFITQLIATIVVVKPPTHRVGTLSDLV